MTSPERPKILCIDDEVAILDSLERALRRDFHVLRANSGDEALALIETHPDLAVVLSDQRMPGRSGLDVLKVAKEKVPQAVRAILSGQMDLADMVEAINTTLIHRFIVKPWDNEYLRVQMIEALQNHKLLQEKNWLERLSVTDPVTQLTNHRYFQDHLRTELERALRHQRALSLIMLDIDRFKAFNDTFGHPEGDRLLGLVAQRILGQIRSIDKVSRYGGEEFAIVLPDTDADDALRVGERIRRAFEGRGFAGPQGDVKITASLGIASCPRHAMDATTLVEAADRALYRAKGQGRNLAVVADPMSLQT